MKITWFTIYSAGIFAVFNSFLIYFTGEIVLAGLFFSVIAFAVGLDYLEKEESKEDPQ